MGEPEVLRTDGSPASADLVERGRRLFQFLAAAQRLRLKPVRTTESYERDGGVLWFGELPAHPALTLATDAPSPDADAPVLILQRVSVQDPPAPGTDVEPWLDGAHTDPERPPQLRPTRTVFAGDGTREGETVHLEDHPQVESAYRSWRGAWDVWAEQELTDRPARALYKELFAAYTTTTNQPEDYELVLGIGCLAWAPEEHDKVRRHTLVTPGIIDFDELTGTLTVRTEPALDSLTVELDMLDPGRVPAAHLRRDVVERARVQEAHPLDRAATGDLLRRLVNSLDADGRYDDVDNRPGIGAVPVVAFAPAVVLRRRSQIGLIAVFEQIEAAIAETGAVPSGLMPLLDPDHVPVVDPDPTPGAMIDIDDDVFLPLPLNEAQLDIIQRVDRQAQTLVQGPPGTGKTHLAAALISHLLAQGKRVLVTAHTDRALHEVRGKLPEEIKPLAVAVVGTDSSDMTDLKVAVERISSRSNEGDAADRDQSMRRDIEQTLASLDDVRRRRADLRTRLVAARGGEIAERTFAGYTGTLTAIARTYRDQADHHAWIAAYLTPDIDATVPLDNDDAARWLALLRDADVAADEAEASTLLADLAALPTPEQFATLLDRYTTARSGYDTVADWTRHPAYGSVRALPAEHRSGLQQRMAEVARQIGAFEQRRESWMAQALQDIRAGRAATWTGRAEHINGLLVHAWPVLQHLGPATHVTIADSADCTAIGSLAQYLRDHLHGGGTVKLNPDGSVKLGTFTDKAIKNSRLLFEAVQVDGRPPTTLEQLTALVAYLEVDRHLNALDQAWPADVHIPAEDTLHERFQWHATELQLLQQLLAVGQEIAHEHHRFEQLRLPQPDWSDLDAVRAFAHLVNVAARHDAHDDAASPLRQLSDSTANTAQRAGSGPTCTDLAQAVRGGDRRAYETAYHRTRWLLAIRGMVAERDALTARLTAAAPALAAAVTASPHDEVWTARIPALTQAWDWVRVGAWILGQQTEDANELQQQLDVAELEIHRRIERLAGLRAWRHALAPARLTGQARADLNMYVRLVKRLGKGTGKYAQARRAEIRQVMDRCRPAVPVWIMPIYRIAEQLQVTENMFDVVIVDEASQAGLEATFLQYLAPKIVVIGDDKQVSPAAVGVDQQQLRDLAGQFLGDHRYKASWQDPKLSLFDAASIWYGNKRTLVEHRRCVPEIIGFSNRIAYEPENIRLVPVRQFGADRLDPVKVVHVPDGYETGGSGTKVNRAEV